MRLIVLKNHALSTSLRLLRNTASPKSVFSHHHYLAPPLFHLKGIFISRHPGLPFSRVWSPSHSIRRFCSVGSVGLEKSLVVSNAIGAVKNESNVVADKLVKILTDYSKPAHKMEDDLDHWGTELTTPLVMEVLQRVRFEELLAFRFFTWAGHQENYTHEPCAYNSMIDILSNTNHKVKQFRIVCDMLDYMKRKNTSWIPIDALLVILRQYTEKHLPNLNKFAKKKKIRVKTRPEIFAFNVLLDALCRCSLVEEAEAMLRRVQSTVKPIAETYNILFFGWCRVRNAKRGMIVLEEMIKIGFTPNNFTYNTAIETFCKSGLIAEAEELLKFMKTQGSTISAPTAKTYAIMIIALVKNDRMEQCFELLGDMIITGCLPDVSTYKDLIEIMCSTGKIEAAYRVLEEMSNAGYPPDVVTYNCFLKVLCDKKESEEVLRLYRRMIKVGCIPSVQTYNMIIEMYFKINDIEGAFEAWHEMDRRGCDRNTETCCVMIQGLFNTNNAKEACSLLEEVVSKGVKLPYQTFSSFLKQLSAIGDLQSIHRLSDHMRRFYNPAMARRFTISEKRNSRCLRGK